MLMEFAKLLTKYRNRKGISKTQLAGFLNVTPAYLMLVESGRRKPPTFEICQKLSKELHLDETERKLFLKRAFEERLDKNEGKFLIAIYGNLYNAIDELKSLLQEAKTAIDHDGDYLKRKNKVLAELRVCAKKLSEKSKNK